MNNNVLRDIIIPFAKKILDKEAESHQGTDKEGKKK